MTNFFKRHNKQKTLYGIITIASVIGFLAAFLQMLEKLALLRNADTNLVCNINAFFSCSNILNAWQSSVFGFPNSLMCVSFFAITMTAGLIGWTSGSISKTMRLIFQGMTIFFVGFGFWYFWQSIFAIGSICLYCIFCYVGVLAVSYAWLRLNHKDISINEKSKKLISRMVASNTDILIWLGIAIIIVAEMIIKFN